jgi:hypothetical protein
MTDLSLLQTRFKRPYKRRSSGLATHTPYNPRRRLNALEALSRPHGKIMQVERLNRSATGSKSTGGTLPQTLTARRDMARGTS